MTTWLANGPPPSTSTAIPGGIGDLCAFCNMDSLPAIAQAATAHAQFETIHPFLDGNGRTGRALIHVILRRRGLAAKVLPPVAGIVLFSRRANQTRMTARAARTLASACAGLGMTAAIIGCGSAGQGPTRSGLIAKADAICSRTDAEAAAASSRIHVRRTPDGPRQAFIRTAEATLPISDSGLAQLRDLQAPSSMRADWQRLLEDVRRENAAGRALLADARSLNTIAAAESQLSLQAAQLDLESVSTKDGFSVCGKAAHA